MVSITGRDHSLAARETHWSVAIRAMRDDAEARRRANAAAFPRYVAPGSTVPKRLASYYRLSKGLQVKILAYLAIDLHVTIRKTAGTPHTAIVYETIPYIVNVDEWRVFTRQFDVSESFGRRMEEAYRLELSSKRIAIVLDTRNSLRSLLDGAASEWYTIATQSNEREIDRVSPERLGRYLALRLISPYLIRDTMKVFTVTVTRPMAVAPVDNFFNANWQLVASGAGEMFEHSFDNILWNVYHPYSEGTDFGTHWPARNLAYYHDVLANIAIDHVQPRYAHLPGPTSLARALEVYHELMG